jgi:hypothetical protein
VWRDRKGADERAPQAHVAGRAAALAVRRSVPAAGRSGPGDRDRRTGDRTRRSDDPGARDDGSRRRGRAKSSPHGDMVEILQPNVRRFRCRQRDPSRLDVKPA